MKKIYIAGPITGLENGNRENFDRVAKTLRDAGHVVTNPHELCSHFDPETTTHIEYMQVCLKEIVNGEYDIIFALRGWEKSKGAIVEVLCAQSLGCKLYSEECITFAVAAVQSQGDLDALCD